MGDLFFEDSEKVKKRHGPRDVESLAQRFTGISFVPGHNGSLPTLSADRKISLVIATAIDQRRGRAEKSQKEASTLRKVRWALSGKARSERLLQEFAWFVDRLHAVVPISAVQMLHQRTRRLEVLVEFIEGLLQTVSVWELFYI